MRAGFRVRVNAQLPCRLALIAQLVLVGAITLRSNDDVDRVVDTSAAIAHSRLLRSLLAAVGERDDPIPLAGVADAELELIVEFIGATAVEEVDRAAQWAGVRLGAARQDALHRLLIAADYLDVRSLVVAIASAVGQRSWNDSWLPAHVSRLVMGIARIRHVALTEDQMMIASHVCLLVVVGGGNATAINSAPWDDAGNVLYWAAERGEELVAELLVDLPGVDPNTRADDLLWTPLHRAAFHGHRGTVALLLRVPGIDVNARDCYRKTPLHHAAARGHAAVVDLLLKSPGINIRARDIAWWTPQNLARSFGRCRASVDLLLGALAKSGSSTGDG